MSVETVHSMTGDAAAPDWPHLTTEDIATVALAFELERHAPRIAWHSPRPLSAAAIADLGGRRLFFKRHHRLLRTAPELAEEHRFIAHLRSRGARVARVLSARTGATAFAWGEWTYEVHELGAGVDAYRDAASWTPFLSEAHAHAAGRALGRLHRAARGYSAPPRSAHVLVSNDDIIRCEDPLARIERLCLQRPALGRYLGGRPWRRQLREAILPFHGEYLRFAHSLQPLWTHNDWHASNLLWSAYDSSASVTTILDFGLSDRTSAVYDLATAVERNVIPWLDIHAGERRPSHLVLARLLIEGYLDIAPLTPLERRALLAILPIVHVGYALAEIEYFEEITRSSSNAELAYEAFLLGHCHWFMTAEGRELLEQLRVALGVLDG